MTRTRTKVDVLVAGGGTAGVIAAVAAARMGMHTLLIEQNGFVGGTAAMGLPMMGFHNNQEEQIVGGIPWELVERLFAVDGAALIRNTQVGGPRGRGSSKFNAVSIAYHPEALKYVCLQMLKEAGVEILLHTFVSDVVRSGDAVAGLIVENKSGRTVVPAERVVDCTGDADVAAHAGAPWEKGRAGDGRLQPMTLMFQMSNIDLPQALAGGVLSYRRQVVGSAAWQEAYGSYLVQLGPLEKEMRAEMPEYAGRLKAFSIWDFGDGTYYTGNLVHIVNLDASDGEQLSLAEVEARLLVWRLSEFVRRHVPGFQRAHLVNTMAAIGIRETRRIIGEYVLSLDDVLEARRFPDGIALCGYRVDIHAYDGQPEYEEPKRGTQVKGYGAYEIPYRSLIPQQIDDLLVAGRCISASHEAQASCRVIGTAMALGHAAGVAAALSVQQAVSPRRLGGAGLRQSLLQQGVYLGSGSVT